MVAGGLPTVQVLLDDGTGTFPYDVTSKTRLGYAVTRGRSDELAAVNAGQMTTTHDNTDGRFTPGSTVIASPSPVKTDQRLRLKVTANATTVTRHTGYAQSFPVGWPGGGQELSEVTITTSDAQARAERRVLRSVVEEEIMADAPAAYYTLGEPEGATSAGDTSGNQAAALTMAGSGTAVTFGTATGPGTDGLTAATFAGGQWLTTIFGGDWMTPPGAVEFAFSTTTNDATTRTILGSLSGGDITLLNGHMYQNGVDFGFVADGAVHEVFWNGSERTALDNFGRFPAIAPLYGYVGIGGPNTSSASGTPFIGAISHVALYASTFSDISRITAHYNAMTTGFAGETDNARITRLAGYAGISTGTLDTSLTNVPFTDLTGRTAWECIQEVADAAMGVAFIAGDGTLRFHNRQKVVAKTTYDLTIDANQLDPGTAFTTDMQGVLNYVEVTAAGTSVTQVARNTASETTHGRYSDSKTYLVSTDAEALDRGNWLVGIHAEPTVRVGTLSVDLLSMTAANQAAWLAVEPSHWIRVTGLPSQTPGGTTADLVVQGISDTLTAGPSGSEWTLSLNVVSKSLYPTPWILQDATYGVLNSTTKLGL